MSFVRPEARATLWRWREALVGLCSLGFGAWWALSGTTLTRWIGLVIVLLALALIVAGWQRGRFRGPAGGLGVVRVDEGQIAYFGPLTGGIVALSEITELAYDATGKPVHWVLSQPGQADLHIPVDADGADALFDAFTSLPGLKTEEMLGHLTRRLQARKTLWRRGAPTFPLLH